MERVADISIDSDGEELQLRIKPGGRLKSALAWLFNFPASSSEEKRDTAPPAEKQEAPSRHAIAGAQPKPALRRFDDETDKAIATAYLVEKLSIPELVERFGGTHPSIGAALDRQNVTRRSTSEAMMISLARRNGLDPTALPVSNAAPAMRVLSPHSRGKLDAAQSAEVVRRYRDEFEAPADLAIAYGVSVPTIRSTLDRAGVPIRNGVEAKAALAKRKAFLATQSPAARAFGAPSGNQASESVAPKAPPIAAPVPRKDEVIDGPMRRQNDGPTKRAATNATEPSRESDPGRDDDEAELARLAAMDSDGDLDRDAEIERLYRGGLSVQQVADALWLEREISVGLQTINRVLKARGVPKRSISDAMALKHAARAALAELDAKLPPAAIPADAPVEEIVIDPMRKLYDDTPGPKKNGWVKRNEKDKALNVHRQKVAAERTPLTPALMQDAVAEYFKQGGTVKRVTAIEAPKAGGTPVGTVGYGGRTRRGAPG